MASRPLDDASSGRGSLSGEDVVAFYSHVPIHYRGGREGYHCLSNYSAHAITVGGKRYATSEHYYQSQKQVGGPYEERIRLAPTPHEAKRLGNAYTLPGDWEHRKERAMLEALVAKFTQNDYCYEVLLGTGNARIEERAPCDGYWGTGSRGAGGLGQNRLGILLEAVRDELRETNAL
jgi:N-glycosidase YbiA